MRSGTQQSGVALLQVLLISAVISVLAIRFSYTARDHLDIAKDFDRRIRAQLLAGTVFNEVLFKLVSNSTIALDTNSERLPGLQGAGGNRHGEPFDWRGGVAVSIQDLNGLLPRLYPRHFLWRELLENIVEDTEDIDRYLGVWSDLQDADGNSWQKGKPEPISLKGGQVYPNRLAQDDLLLLWTFADNPMLGRRLANYSSLYPYAEINPLNMPSQLIEDLFEPDLAANIKRVRSGSDLTMAQMKVIFPDKYLDGGLHFVDSQAARISVMVPLEQGSWRESWTVRMAIGGNRPFFLLAD